MKDIMGNANFRLAIGLGITLIIWMASGWETHSKQIKKSQDTVVEKNLKVQVKTSRAIDYQRQVHVRAKSEANRSVMVAAEVEGQVTQTPVREGSIVQQGDPLCVLDSQDRKLRMQQAGALLDKAKLDYEGALKLKDGGYQSKTTIASAKANLALAEAEFKAKSLDHDKLVIRAPFDGVVQDRLVEAGGYLQRGATCAKLLELSTLLVTGHVSESELALIQLGDLAAVQFLNGKNLSGKVRYVSSAADPMTRTFKVDIEIDNKNLDLVDGLSADITIRTPAVPAHLISPSLLSLLDDDGHIGVKILDQENRVQEAGVEVIGDDAKGVWVTGLPETITLITVGQEYVSPGAIVSTVDEQGVSGVAQ